MIMMADQNKRTRSASRSDANVDQSEILKGIRENLYDVVKAIANSVQTPITNENIDLAYRNKKKNIVAKFLQTHARDKIMNGFKAKSKTTPMLAKDLGFRSCSNRVYVNEFLLFDTRQLFFEVRKFQKRHNYKYSWTVNQKVYLRQAEGTPAIRVIDMSSLDDINTG